MASVFKELQRIITDMPTKGEETIRLAPENEAAWEIYNHMCSQLNRAHSFNDDTIMARADLLIPAADSLQEDFFAFKSNARRTVYTREFPSVDAMKSWVTLYKIVAKGNGFSAMLANGEGSDQLDGHKKASKVRKLAISAPVFEKLCAYEDREPPATHIVRQ